MNLQVMDKDCYDCIPCRLLLASAITTYRLSSLFGIFLRYESILPFLSVWRCELDMYCHKIVKMELFLLMHIFTEISRFQFPFQFIGQTELYSYRALETTFSIKSSHSPSVLFEVICMCTLNGSLFSFSFSFSPFFL